MTRKGKKKKGKNVTSTGKNIFIDFFFWVCVYAYSMCG